MLVEKQISISSYLKVLNSGIALFFSLTMLIPLSAFIFSVLVDSHDLDKKSGASLFFQDKEGEKKRVSLTDQKLENSFISLNNNELKTVFFPDFEKEFVVLEHTQRPDLVKKEDLFLVGLESSQEKRLAYQGEKIYLTCKNGQEISFALSQTPFWCQFYEKECGRFEVQFAAEFKGVDKTSLYSDNQMFVVDLKKDFSTGAIFCENKLALISQFLAKVKIYEPDLFIQLYGGKSFEGVKGLYRMISGSDSFFIKEGEFFVWRNGKLEQEKNRTQNAPLLLVKSLDSFKCEIVVWDSEGIYNKFITIPLTKNAPSNLKLGEFFSKIHQRTDVSVTCQLHGRNVIVRKGDWLLCQKGQFRNLRTADEIKDYLRYALKGELFIFDGIVKKEGVTLFTGHLFNEERTALKKVEIALAERKKAPPSKKKETKVAPQQVRDE
jgi:hypothetical protein